MKAWDARNMGMKGLCKVNSPQVDFKAEEVAALRRAIQRKEHLREGLLCTTVWAACQGYNDVHREVGKETLFISAYGMTDPLPSTGRQPEIFKGVMKDVLQLCQRVAEGKLAAATVIMPIFAGHHYVASCLSLTKEVGVLRAVYRVADSFEEPWGPTQIKAEAAFAGFKDGLGTRVQWSTEGCMYSALGQQKDAAADRSASEWSCGLHMVANCISWLREGRWAQSRAESGLSWRDLRKAHWDLTICAAAKVLAE